MKVSEWIEWLKTQPQNADLLLCDPDTEWFLPLQTEHTYSGMSDGAPPNSVVVFAEYGE